MTVTAALRGTKLTDKSVFCLTDVFDDPLVMRAGVDHQIPVNSSPNLTLLAYCSLLQVLWVSVISKV